ncbi:G-type lectin S-receptor-like serine/threonine-protein kinase At1g11300 isoform X2 [Eutrema salsugineum]|uniref:G-type lectin S-receptor-like serine/threonine-protein kinase At1g11300 isoform X2 n=1 Tax=Eutrema salsugineum TaxID=72664 RepID=UPI000CED4D2D|nr:G-type lectin S-receptor-like serine/threonine-protein kinase At1g11300 isoform X2 [Eutrema salsugineum]
MGLHECMSHFVLVLVLSWLLSSVCLAQERAFFFGNLSDSETIVSSFRTFRFGFFSPVNSTSKYAGIWYNSIPVQTVIWVANKDMPINDSSGVISVSEDGNLLVTDGQRRVLWSTNVSTQVRGNSSTVAELLDSGNLVLKDTNNDAYLWESFRYPTDSWLPNMLVGTNARNGGGNITITSWKTPSDPSPGSYTAELVLAAYPELFILNNSNSNATVWRSGPWNGQMFNGLPDVYAHFLYKFIVNDDTSGSVTMSYANDSTLRYFYMDYRGSVIRRDWSEARRNWTVGLQVPATECDIYGRCGQFATCNPLKTPPCSCIRGFKPRNLIEWNNGNWSGGCIRRVPLQCERQNNNRSADGFARLRRMKLPDFARRSEASEPECLRTCLQTCSCIACAHGLGYACMIWNGSLVDSQVLPASGMDLYIRLAHSEISGIIVLAACGLLARRIVMKKRGRKEGTDAEQIFERVEALAGGNKGKLKELPLFEFQVLAAATDNFSLTNKLGQGGFGPVYKGKLQEGQEIAVKRLSRASVQGLEELVNEVVVISKLQHRNLVKLLGCCIAGEERILVYEFMPKKSLDFYLFDPTKAKLLDWKTRLNIINGICRGLLYLHRDSRLRIIHRDLKAGNILLDENLIPKISDFGLARIFPGDEDEANTIRVVGTYGYMSPEYAMGGLFSEKSDVFSLGVILLEIVSGRRNSNSPLLANAWSMWNDGEINGLVDPVIFDQVYEKEIQKCVHIGLLCVQEYANDRPSVATVCSMLSSEIADIPEPKQSAFISRNAFIPRTGVSEAESSENSDRKASIIDVTITDVTGR